MQLKVGLEIHQQLATETKLFCACPPYIGEEQDEEVDQNKTVAETDSSVSKNHEFRRILRPATSELGELDIAAKFESRREIKVGYVTNPNTSCLVEADEEPPHPISEDAVDTALLFSLALGSRIADEIHVMRKIVVDGSNTSGFQRTSVIALGGKLLFGGGSSSVAVQSISLEEDAARAVKEKSDAKGVKQPKEEDAGQEVESGRTYALDRLGTPLVEVALAPIEGTPEEAEDAARTLGRLMRSTGRVARGLGTIRQDLNVSVMNGSVIQVKGVQRLDQISKAVLFEAWRQKFFFDLAAEIREKVGAEIDISVSDVTNLFQSSKSNVLKKALLNHSSVVECLIVRKFAGFFGRENSLKSRLGKELGAIAKTYGLGGIFHSDELPNYGITQEEVDCLRSELRLDQKDAFVLIAGQQNKVERCTEAIIQRIQYSTKGVPPETRAASVDGETVFLRPRPGSARMYPETDIPLIPVTPSRLDALRHQIPEPWDKIVSKFAKKFDLPSQLAEPLFDSDYRDLFEKIVATTKLAPRYVASVLIDIFQSLAREGVPVYSLKLDIIADLFRSLNEGKFAKEAMPDVLRTLAAEPLLDVQGALSKAGISTMNTEECDCS